MAFWVTVTEKSGGFLTALWVGREAFFIYGTLILLLLFICLYIWRRKNYALPCFIEEQRGDVVVPTMKPAWLGRWTTPDGRDVWMFKKGLFGILRKGETIPPQHYQLVSQIEGSIGIVRVLRYGNGEYKVLDPRSLLAQGDFKIVDIDMQNWKNQEIRATFTRRADTKERWQQVFPYIALFLGLLFVFATAYIHVNLTKYEIDRYSNLKSDHQKFLADLSRQTCDTIRTFNPTPPEPAPPQPATPPSGLDILKPS